MKIYLDMDGVLADFDKKKKEVFGKSFDEDLTLDEWKAIEDFKGGWFQSLEWTSDGKQLWEFLFDNDDWDVNILTGTPKTGRDNSINGKKAWLRKNLEIENLSDWVYFCRSADKQQFSTRNSILIDDRGRNVAQWINRGGIGILYRNAFETIQFLNELITHD